MLNILETIKLISEEAADPNSKLVGHCTSVLSYQKQTKEQKVCLPDPAFDLADCPMWSLPDMGCLWSHGGRVEALLLRDWGWFCCFSGRSAFSVPEAAPECESLCALGRYCTE